jgi:hypothetical protein
VIKGWVWRWRSDEAGGMRVSEEVPGVLRPNAFAMLNIFSLETKSALISLPVFVLVT